MVEQQLKRRGIRDEAVLEAFYDVPRHRFVPESERPRAYEDRPLPIGQGQTISQPYVVALMLEQLGVRPRQRVLEIGVGSGYQTALLEAMGAEVVGIERVAELAHRARDLLGELGFDSAEVVVGDGTLGCPDRAPYDRIICAAGAPEVPPAWIEQLAEQGRMLLPVGSLQSQTLLRLDKINGQMRRTDLGPVRFVPLLGADGWET